MESRREGRVNQPIELNHPYLKFSCLYCPAQFDQFKQLAEHWHSEHRDPLGDTIEVLEKPYNPFRALLSAIFCRKLK